MFLGRKDREKTNGAHRITAFHDHMIVEDSTISLRSTVTRYNGSGLLNYDLRAKTNEVDLGLRRETL